jgi:uncharacterized membrane protein
MVLQRSPHFMVLAFGYLLGLALFSRLPEEIPPSWTTSNDVVVWIGRPIAAFLLPTAAAITFFMLRPLCTSDALHAYDAIMLRIVLFLMAVHTTVLAGMAGLLWGRPWAARIVPVLLGSVLIGVGNLLPRTRPNLVIGIRTSQTLSDRALWTRTHRLAGYIVVTMGVLILVAGLVAPQPVGSRMSLMVGPFAVLSIPFLLLYSRKHVRA